MSEKEYPPLTAEEIEQIRERCAKASLGPWRWEYDEDLFANLLAPGDDGTLNMLIESALFVQSTREQEHSDAEFIDHARTDVPRLLATLDQERAQAVGLVDALQYAISVVCNAREETTADPEVWRDVLRRFLDTAHNALSGTGAMERYKEYLQVKDERDQERQRREAAEQLHQTEIADLNRQIRDIEAERNYAQGNADDMEAELEKAHRTIELLSEANTRLTERAEAVEKHNYTLADELAQQRNVSNEALYALDAMNRRAEVAEAQAKKACQNDAGSRVARELPAVLVGAGVVGYMG